MMWLDRFLFCGSTLGPTSNMQELAESLVQGKRVPLGQYLLGATFHMLHQAARKLSSGDAVGHLGGPWWFLQLWLTIYTAKVAQLPPFSESRFPSSTFAEGAQPILRRCTSLGEAAIVAPGHRLTDQSLADWFRHFYIGFASEAQVWFAYGEADNFEIPFKFRPDSPLADDDSKLHLVAFILPRLLFVGVAPGRAQHLSYEFYNPSVCARQLGFGQLPIGLFFIDKLQAREPVASGLEYIKINGLTAQLPIGDLEDFSHSPFCTRLFFSWWNEWRLHIFNSRCSSFLTPLVLPDVPEEVNQLSYLFLPSYSDDLVLIGSLIRRHLMRRPLRQAQVRGRSITLLRLLGRF